MPKGETEEVLDKKLVDTDVSNDDQETIATDVERRLLHGRSGQRKSDAVGRDVIIVQLCLFIKWMLGPY